MRNRCTLHRAYHSGPEIKPDILIRPLLSTPTIYAGTVISQPPDCVSEFRYRTYSAEVTSLLLQSPASSQFAHQGHSTPITRLVRISNILCYVNRFCILFLSFFIKNIFFGSFFSQLHILLISLSDLTVYPKKQNAIPGVYIKMSSFILD